MKRKLFSVWLLLAACLAGLVGCASPPVWQPPPAQYALAPQTDSAFAAAEQSMAGIHGPSVSGCCEGLVQPKVAPLKVIRPRLMLRAPARSM